MPLALAVISCIITLFIGLSEVFSDKSEMSIIFSTIDYCNKHPEVTYVLGKPVTLRASTWEVFSDLQAHLKK